MRRTFWAIAWWFAATSAFDYLWPDASLWWLLAEVPVLLVVVFTAYTMTENQSLRWRWLMIRHWGALHRPLVLDEDGNLRGFHLPFEALCFTRAADVLVEAHVHTRTLLLGRETIRAETVWRPDLLRGVQ